MREEEEVPSVDCTYLGICKFCNFIIDSTYVCHVHFILSTCVHVYLEKLVQCTREYISVTYTQLSSHYLGYFINVVLCLLKFLKF